MYLRHGQEPDVALFTVTKNWLTAFILCRLLPDQRPGGANNQDDQHKG
jgi:hypothetical protein